MSDLLSPPIFRFDMTVPIPLRLVLTSASLCLLNVILFPDVFLQEAKLTKSFLIITAIMFVLWGVWEAFIYPRWGSPLRNIPTVTSGVIPLIGHPTITFRRPGGDTFLKFMTEIPNDGLIIVPGLMNSQDLLLSDPSTLAEVLVHKSYDFEKPSEIRNIIRLVLGDGLIVAEGDNHKFQRKHLIPAFSFRHIRDLVPVFWSKAGDLVGRLAAELYENPSPTDESFSRRPKHIEGVLDLNQWSNKVAMDIIGVAGLGRQFNSLYSAEDELIDNYQEILEPSYEKGLYFAAALLLPRSLLAALPWKLNQRLDETTASLRRICRQLLQDKTELAKTSKEQPVDILSLLIKSNNFSDEMLVDEILTFLAAGHETTSSALTWGSYLLAKHPEIQTRLRDEIRSNLPPPSATSNSNIDIAAVLESLPYLTAVCNEILRLYPTVPITMRVAIRETAILTQQIPKGTKIYISPWAINRSPLLWGDQAAEFVPERWIDPSTGKANNTGGVRSNYSNLTFLHGPRSCIGEKFAKSELKALIAVFVGTFAMEMADKDEVPIAGGAITLKATKGMRLRLKGVEGW